jgi:hypothetical protein
VRAINTALAIVMLGTTTSSPADHLPANLISPTTPERRLGFMTLEKTTVSDLVTRYGKPTEIKNHTEDNDLTRGERSYSWRLADCKLRVWTWFYPGHESAVTAVDVWGNRPSQGCSTSRGLSLGSSMADLRKTYGRFQHNRKSTDHTLYALVEWRDGTQADVDFNHNNKVSHIQLSTSVE